MSERDWQLVGSFLLGGVFTLLMWAVFFPEALAQVIVFLLRFAVLVIGTGFLGGLVVFFFSPRRS